MTPEIAESIRYHEGQIDSIRLAGEGGAGNPGDSMLMGYHRILIGRLQALGALLTARKAEDDGDMR